jgi:hypothetical protein
VDTYQTRDALASLVFGGNAFAGEGALQVDTYNTYVTGCNPA